MTVNSGFKPELSGAGRVKEIGKVPSCIGRRAGDRKGYHGFVGASVPMQQVYAAIEAIAATRASVFVTGESGTGKEVAAEALHKAGDRSACPFVAINCGAIPENLLESEIFGHVRGAFTGATDNRIGAAKAADGGTLFLDEICELDLKLQVKLLRFLQTGTIQRVGASTPEAVDVRVVCATNRDPLAELAAGRFREDLFYRLAVVPLAMPPLRDRGGDALLIAETLLKRLAAEEGRYPLSFTADARDWIMRHEWPGNVRELYNAVCRAVILSRSNTIDASDLVHPLLRQRATANAPAEPPVTGDARTLEAIERGAIERAVARASGNLPLAARELGVSASTLYRKRDRWTTANG